MGYRVTFKLNDEIIDEFESYACAENYINKIGKRNDYSIIYVRKTHDDFTKSLVNLFDQGIPVYGHEKYEMYNRR